MTNGAGLIISIAVFSVAQTQAIFLWKLECHILLQGDEFNEFT